MLSDILTIDYYKQLKDKEYMDEQNQSNDINVQNPQPVNTDPINAVPIPAQITTPVVETINSTEPVILPPNKRQINKKSFFASYVALLIIGTIIIIAIYSINKVTNNATDISQFNQQSTDMKAILSDLQTASNSTDEWVYSEFCDRYYGQHESFPNRCFSVLYSFIEADADTHLGSVNEKYFPILKTISKGGFSGSGFESTSEDIDARFVRGSATSKNDFYCSYTASYSKYKPGDSSDGRQITTDEATDTIVIALNCKRDTNQSTYPISPYNYGFINGSADLYIVVNRI